MHVQGARPGRMVLGARGGQARPETFGRSVTLPGPVDAERVAATLAYGILRIEIPKCHPASPPRTIPLASPEPELLDVVAAIHLKELYDPETGRLDAKRIAAYLDLPLKSLAKALGKKYTSVHKTPAAPSLQPDLQRIQRILEMLEDALGDRSSVLAWCHRPHSDLGNRTPMDVLLAGHPGAISDMLEAALIGTPT